MTQRDASDSSDAGRLRRLQALDELLHTLTGVLDMREVFVRVSDIAQKVLPHDMIAMPVIDREQRRLRVFAGHDPQGQVISFPEVITFEEQHRRLLDTDWDFLLHGDIQDDPVERETPPGRAGFRSILRFAIRLEGQLAGVLDFGSYTPHFYTQADALIGRRIADHLTLTLSHHRLAEQSRQSAALREREKNLEMLDELLATLALALDIRDVFQQVSAIATRVLAHDMMSLLLLSDDRNQLIIHAVAGHTMQFPQTVPMPDHLRALADTAWDHLLYADVQSDPIARTWPPALAGYRAALAVPIRLNGVQVASMDLWSRQPDAYQIGDALVARRIADHIALALSHQRLSEEAERAAQARERAITLERRVRTLTAEVESLGGRQRIIGQSTSWQRVLTQATQVAATDTTAMLLGESGTGKEVVARFIHRASARSGGPFVALNCAALPEQLLESELFGYERGAFTGAQTAKPGQLEQAAGGTLFLDEVSEMSLAAQAKFLRVLQEKEFQRLGGTRMLKSNARVIAATNRDLHSAIEQGTFREDLYYRLQVFEIALPPLRDRRDDVLPLSEAFLEDLAKAFGRPPAGISRDARQMLMEYHWPGNVRQLRNTLERAAILCEGGLITAEHLSLPARTKRAAQSDPPSAGAPTVPTEASDLRLMERTMIENALREARHNKSKAAKQLGLTRTQLYVRLRKYGLDA